jgi:hypothetical protein
MAWAQATDVFWRLRIKIDHRLLSREASVGVGVMHQELQRQTLAGVPVVRIIPEVGELVGIFAELIEFTVDIFRAKHAVTDGSGLVDDVV